MRLYKKKDFKAELRKYGVNPTKNISQGHRRYEHESGNVFYIDDQKDVYPESLLANILNDLGILYHPPND